MTRHHIVVDSPLGPLTLVDEDGALARLGNDGPDPARDGARDDSVLPDLRAQLSAYFDGNLQTFDVPLAAGGTPFQQRVWAVLRAIPYGQTRSYGQVAAEIGQASAVRAVGAANGRNPIMIVVPCHRVVAADGSLHGYAGGLERKQALLDLERGQSFLR